MLTVMHMALSMSLMCGALTCGSPTLIHYSNTKLQLIMHVHVYIDVHARLPWSSQSHLGKCTSESSYHCDALHSKHPLLQYQPQATSK